MSNLDRLKDTNKNYQKGVSGFTKIEAKRLRAKKLLFCQTDKEAENLTRASTQLGVARADIIRLALSDYLERLDIDYLKPDEIIDINQLRIEL
jgi:hypothetical protein